MEPSGNTFPRERRYHRPRRGGCRPPIPPPEPLAPLAEIAYNYRWSWTPGGPELFASVDPKRWEACAANPVRLLQETHPERLAAVARAHRPSSAASTS